MKLFNYTNNIDYLDQLEKLSNTICSSYSLVMIVIIAGMLSENLCDKLVPLVYVFSVGKVGLKGGVKFILTHLL